GVGRRDLLFLRVVAGRQPESHKCGDRQECENTKDFFVHETRRCPAKDQPRIGISSRPERSEAVRRTSIETGSQRNWRRTGPVRGNSAYPDFSRDIPQTSSKGPAL